MADDRHLRRMRLGGDPAEPAKPLARQVADRLGDLRRTVGDGVELPGAELHHPRRLGGATAGLERAAIHQGNFAMHLAGGPLADLAIDAVDQLDDIELSLEDQEKRGFLSLVNDEFADAQTNIGRDLRELGEIGRLQRRKQRDGGEFFNRDHCAGNPPFMRVGSPPAGAVDRRLFSSNGAQIAPFSADWRHEIRAARRPRPARMTRHFPFGPRSV